VARFMGAGAVALVFAAMILTMTVPRRPPHPYWASPLQKTYPGTFRKHARV